MLVWGGDRRGPNQTPLPDGAAYDPATNRWQRIPDAPKAAGASTDGGVDRQQAADLDGQRPGRASGRGGL